MCTAFYTFFPCIETTKQWKNIASVAHKWFDKQVSHGCAVAQPGLHFGGGGNFHEISFDDAIVFIQPWYNFFANGHTCFFTADTKPIVQTHILHNAGYENRTFYNSVGGWITGVKQTFWLHAIAHAQSNILHIKYAEKTDNYGLRFGV